MQWRVRYYEKENTENKTVDISVNIKFFNAV